MRHTFVASLALVGGAVACTMHPMDSVTEKTASQSEAVWTRGSDGNPVASNDADTPERNVVVRIPHILADGVTEDPNDPGCNGVFVTPALVLTAKYCVTKNPNPVVQVGASRSSFKRFPSVGVRTMPSQIINGLDAGDLALISLATP